MGVAKRSLAYTDFLMLSNDMVIPRYETVLLRLIVLNFFIYTLIFDSILHEVYLTYGLIIRVVLKLWRGLLLGGGGAYAFLQDLILALAAAIFSEAAI